MEMILLALLQFLMYLLCLLQGQVVATSSKCDELLESETWLADDGSIVATASHPRFIFEPCPPHQNESSNNNGIEITGMCILCSSVTRILACVGSHVRYLPKPEELPPVLDLYQVTNSDVRIVNANSFSNKTVREILIEHNPINVLSQQTFTGVLELKVLSLASNNLPCFYTSTVDHLMELETLILDDNGLEFAESGNFVKPSSTQGISDAETRGKKIIRSSSNELMLQSLSLAKNPLKKLPYRGFTWLTNSRLSYLSLRGCSIQSADKGKG
jgi:hypothetical protein